ncbi:MAG: ion transporter [Desulfurococcales archaeon]|nr:ion transporter [Desulfurococcales archaeon]
MRCGRACQLLRRLADLVASRLHPLLGVGARRGAEAAEEAIRLSSRVAEELRRELFGDTMFLETIMASLALLSVVTLLGDLLFPAGSAQAQSIYRVDLAICTVLGLEYAFRWWRSRDREAFLRHYWYEILAFIPAYAVAGLSSGVAAILRLLRLARVYRVYRLFGTRNIYLRMMVDILREARLLQLLTVFLVGLSFTSLLAFMAEARSPASSMDSLSDAFWWSLATVTTVGYGDVVPVTPLGKALGVALMLFGIAVLGGFISLTSASVLRVLSRYQRLYRRPGLLDDYSRFHLLASQIADLSEEELEEFIGLARRLNRELNPRRGATLE